ncbi:hypothetical protein [Streptomyces sp. MMS24-I29]|uniref:hypothetical protein n=1 Tax=Streptomyces sp. MMS24-I29 TaxID=3351480 RepID=UPI003C7ED6B1
MTVLFVHEMCRAVRRRDDPQALSRLKGSAEAWPGGVLINSAGLGGVVTLVTEGFPSGRDGLVLITGIAIGVL